MAQLEKNLWQVKVILVLQKSSSGPQTVGGVWVLGERLCEASKKSQNPQILTAKKNFLETK